MFEKQDSVRTINHQLGKIRLHSKGQRSSTIQVQLVAPRGSFMTLQTRQYGQTWRKAEADQINPGMFRAIHQFLLASRIYDPMFIDEGELKDIPKRFLEKIPVR